MTGGQQYYPDAPPYAGGTPPPSKRPRRSWIPVAIIIGIVVIAVLVGAGILLDRLLFPEHKVSSGPFNLNASISYQEALSDIQRYYFKEYSEEKIEEAAFAAVKEAEKKGEKSSEKLEDIGIKALVGALGDEHSVYYNATENERLKEDIQGTFFGVGFVLRQEKNEDRPKVNSVIKNSPAEKAGIKKDDVILKVDGKDTKGAGLEVVVSWIRGKEGTEVELEVERPGEPKPLKFKLTREKIQIPELETEIIDGKYGWLKVLDFNKGIGDKVRAAIKEMKDKGVQGFILDVRNNPGGLLDEAVNMASAFIPDGNIVSYQYKGDKKFDATAFGNAITDQPVVVLVNGGSASASEIVAGAMKDRGRGVLVGTKTYGKGSVQKVFNLENKGGCKLTVSLYYLPNGETIDGVGIQPDITVEVPDNLEEEDKQQLDRAKQVLQNLIDGKPATGELLRPAA